MLVTDRAGRVTRRCSGFVSPHLADDVVAGHSGDAATGVDHKLVGIVLDGDALDAELSQVWPVVHAGLEVGKVTDAVWSPGLKKNMGYVSVPIELAGPGTALEVDSENGRLRGTTAAIPFVDPRKLAAATTLIT